MTYILMIWLLGTGGPSSVAEYATKADCIAAGEMWVSSAEQVGDIPDYHKFTCIGHLELKDSEDKP